jgi:Fe-S-cluster containining protein
MYEPPLDHAGTLRWAEANLIASAGALVIINGETKRARSLIPKTNGEGACIHYTDEGNCNIHAAAPYGCSMFSVCTTRPFDDELSMVAQIDIMRAWDNPMTPFEELYTLLWKHLDSKGLKETRPLQERKDLISQELKKL